MQQVKSQPTIGALSQLTAGFGYQTRLKFPYLKRSMQITNTAIFYPRHNTRLFQSHTPRLVCLSPNDTITTARVRKAASTHRYFATFSSTTALPERKRFIEIAAPTTAAARPVVTVVSSETGKPSGSMSMPAVFTAQIRNDFVQIMHKNMRNTRRQPYGVTRNAG